MDQLVTVIMLTLFFCRWRMEFFKSGLCMRCEACMPLSSTGLGRGVGTQNTLGTTKSSCVCMLFMSIWSNAMGLLGGIGLAQLCLSGRTGRWAGTPCTHYTCDFKSWVRFANLTGIKKGKDGIHSPWDRRKRPQVGKIFREKSEWIQREKRIRNKSRNRNTTGTQNYSTWKLYFWNFSILTWETKKLQYQWWDSDIRHQSTIGKHLPSTRINGIEITKNEAAKEHNLRPTSKFKYHGAKNTSYCPNAFDRPLICSSGILGSIRWFPPPSSSFLVGFLLRFSKGTMIPSPQLPNLREKPPDPIIPPPTEGSGGRRSSSRLAISAKSLKVKDSQSAGKNHHGLVKLNIGDFLPEGFLDRGNTELGHIENSGEHVQETDHSDIGLKFLDNGVVLATTHLMEEDPGDGTTTPVSGNTSNPNSHNICTMNTNDSLPLSPENGQEMPDITMLPVDLNPCFDELVNQSGFQHREVGGEGQKNDSKPQGKPPSTSSDPIIQRKMNDMHKNYIAANIQNRRALNDVTNNRGTSHPDKGKRTQHTSISNTPNPQPSLPSSPKQLVHQHKQAPSKPKNPNNTKNNPNLPADVGNSYLDSSHNRFAALDSDMADYPDGHQCHPMEDQVKFYEFSEETIANVLNFKPSSLSIPRVNDMDLDLGESQVQNIPMDDEVPDFDIPNEKKWLSPAA
ncbi:hypothetical protein L1987_67238 [Smallanthus sonchifolius]|uniref:Uncharacterized protein n=1 Tax=Smallanthus sonchifolius TaxID=185202 RepID=A0ACB9BZH3_9ASTR|nr:hypothetical protein L1987_67238 [Smallanthus sonchifolius]